MLCWLLVILHENVRLTRGGDALFKSSSVHMASLGLSILISCFVQLRRYSSWVILVAFVIVNQHGPLILRLRMNSSSIDYWQPKIVSNVLPVRPIGNGGIVLGYLIFKNRCSPWGSGISKQYFLLTPLHFHLVIFWNLFFLISSSSAKTFMHNWSSSSFVSTARDLPFSFGKAYNVRSMP